MTKRNMNHEKLTGRWLLLTALAAGLVTAVDASAGETPVLTDAGQPDPALDPTEVADEGPFAPDEKRLMDKHAVDGAAVHFKPGTGLVVESSDGDFGLASRLRAQFLYTLEEDKGSDAEQSFQMRRARLQFKGHVYGKDNKFKVELAFSPSDVGLKEPGAPTTTPLLDWYFDFTQSKDASVQMGQFKVPHNRQRLTSSGDLQLVDRSIVNSEFNLDRDIGLMLHSKDLLELDLLGYQLGVFSGQGRNTRDFYDLGMLYAARIEVFPLGMFKDLPEVDFERNTSPKLALGMGYARVQNAARDAGTHGAVPADGGTTDIDSITWDAVFKLAG